MKETWKDGTCDQVARGEAVPVRAKTWENEKQLQVLKLKFIKVF